MIMDKPHFVPRSSWYDGTVISRWTWAAIAGGICLGLVLHDVLVHLVPGL